MDAEYNRKKLKMLAQQLESSFPETDLISLSNEKLSEMLSFLGFNMPNDNVFIFSLKSTWSYLRHPPLASSCEEEVETFTPPPEDYI